MIKPLKKNIDSQAGCFANDIGGRIATLQDMERVIEKGLDATAKTTWTFDKKAARMNEFTRLVK